MHFGEAFTELAKRSPDELREALADQFADVILRAAAALLIAGRQDLAMERKVCWLLENWDAAPLKVRKYILEALGHCPLPQSIAFLKEQLSAPVLRLAALGSLATIGDESILPVCEELLHSETESECRSALEALLTLGTTNATGLVETVLQSSPSESCRQWAAFLLALKGISTGHSLLEKRLSELQPLQIKSNESASKEAVTVEPDYLLIAIALAGINSKSGLLALKRLLDILQGNQNVDRQYVMNMTLGIVKMPATTSFGDWSTALQAWIDERLGVQSK